MELSPPLIMRHRRHRPASPALQTDVPLTETTADNPDATTADPGAAPLPAAPPPDESVPAARRDRPLVTTTTAGWCLSLAIHLTAYTIAAVLFAWFGIDLIRIQTPQPAPSIQASLDDETRLDDLPVLEIVSAAGPESPESPQTLQQLASQLEVADRGQIDTVVTDARLAVAGTSAAHAGDAGESPFFRIPEAGLAVTKGSFTAWTDPPHPLPKQFYQIIIEVRLPDDTKRYRISDLSGEVTGTDGYRQRLPYDARKPGAARVTGGAEFETVRRNMTIKVTGNKLQLAIRVPGAERLVRDRIRIKSKRLHEDEEISLVFGQMQNAPGLNPAEQPEQD